MEDARLSPPQLLMHNFLKPSAALPPRERRLSTSSMDSSLSQISSSSRGRKLNKRGSSRVSDFDDDNDDVTLLSFLQSTHDILTRIGLTTRRMFVTMLRKSKPRPKLVCEGEILEQTNMVCRDFVVTKLTAKDLAGRKLSVVSADWPNSAHVINACQALEQTFPRIYSNVSRKLCMTMTSPKVVRVALNSVLDVMFEGQTTWGKVVSMVCVCGLFAEECSMQGHAEYVNDVVDAVVDFTNARLLEWLVAQGGWDCFPCPKDGDGLRVSLGRTFVAAFLTSCLVISSVLLYRYLMTSHRSSQDGEL